MEDKSPARLPPPDTAMLTQYWDGLRRHGYIEPERYLMLAVLKDALLDYTHNLASRNQRFRSAQVWFFQEQSNRLFSFESICEVLNLSPSYIRGELKAREQAALAQQQRTAA